MLKENEMKVLRKIIGKTKVDQEANRSENPVISNRLLSGWKEEENWTNM